MSTATYDISGDISSDIATIVERARGGDTGAFARIVRQYQALVSGVLFSATGDFHESEDLTQETFLIAWNRLAELREADTLAAWLCTIARNLAHRSHRSKVVNTDHPLNEELPSLEKGPDAELLRREQSELVWSAIGGIEEKYRETLVLYYRSGQSVREIAAVMNVTEDTVNQRLLRARKSLKVKLEQMIGNVLTDTAPGDVFTFGVMAALGAAMVSTTAQTAVAATSGATVVSAGSATTGKAIGFGSLWMIFGPLLYFVWMFAAVFLSQWTVTQNTPTLRARRYRVYSFFLACQYFLPFIGATGIVSAILLSYFDDWASGPIPFLVTFIPTMGGGLLLMHYIQRRVKAIVEDDLGLSEKHVSSYGNQQIERRLRLSVWTNLFLLNGLMVTALMLQIFYDKWTWLSLLITLGVTILFNLTLYAYSLFGKHLLTLCRSPESMTEFPPLIDNAIEVALAWRVQPSFAIEHRKEAGKLIWFRYLIWVGFAGTFIWMLSLLHWHHPLVTGLCVLGLVAGVCLSNYLQKRIKERKTLHLIGAVLGLYQAGLALVLLTLECDGFSFREFWQSTVIVNQDDMVRLPLFLFVVISLAASLVNVVFWIRLCFTKGKET